MPKGGETVTNFDCKPRCKPKGKAATEATGNSKF